MKYFACLVVMFRGSLIILALAAFQAAETIKWRDLVKAANMKPD